ncbi:MAG: DNA double-strand break repair nuclease NurA [Patescibacteria group bacterium]|nr:DNA double-strand break repair nuclease NurA [Patescibacteria group bacterium]
MDQQNKNSNYAFLPDDLLMKMLDKVPDTVGKMNGMFDVQDEPIKKGIEELKNKGLINKITSKEHTTSLIAVDGSNIVEKMTGTDILLAMGVGVEGLTNGETVGWEDNKNQYYQWQTVLPHGDANARLIQGIMFLMELSVLAHASHEVRIMDGNHMTPILKINSMLSAKDENAGPEYCSALTEFLKETYNKIIPDIPDIVSAAFSNENIVAMVKYSSSRDILESHLKDHKDIRVDDKTFFSLGLAQDEYTKPLSVGQSKDENRIWGDLHIKCNLDAIKEKDELNKEFKKVLEKIKTKDYKGRSKESEIYFTYYKPYDDGPAYRIEIKKGIANNLPKLEKYLLSIKNQIVFPEIREPYPQYLVDLMAKSIAMGLFSIQEAIRLSPDLKIDRGKFNLLFNYRT